MRNMKLYMSITQHPAGLDDPMSQQERKAKDS